MVGMAKGSILSVSIKDKAVLYESYMPFLVNGGLFIPTNKKYAMGAEVFLRLSLMDEAEKIPVPGKVVWITPPGSQGNRNPGIGVQFTEANEVARTKIEAYLAGSVTSDRPTSTM